MSHNAALRAEFKDWLAVIYEDAAYEAVVMSSLTLAEAVNHAIGQTIAQLRKRNAPDEFVDAIEASMLVERKTLMFALARLVADAAPPLEEAGHAWMAAAAASPVSLHS